MTLYWNMKKNCKEIFNELEESFIEEEVNASYDIWKNKGGITMKEVVLMFNTSRDGYGIDQCGRTMTVGELIELLNEYDEDTKIYYKNDGGYTYGKITEYRIELEEVEED